MRNALINLGLSLVSAIIFLAGIEIVLRMTGLVTVGPHPPLIFQSSDNPDISYELIPGIERGAYRSTVKTNALGFRSLEIDPTRPLAAVIGDSITFGYGVENEETLAARLEARMPAMQFLNTGVPGYQLSQERATYKEKIAELDPQVIILVFFPNDMDEKTGWLDEDGVLRAEGDDPKDRPALRCNPPEEGILSMIPGKCFLDRRSAVYVAMKKFTSMRAGKETLEREREESKENPDRDSITEKQITAYGEALHAFAEEIDEGIEKYFVLWPDRELHALSRPRIRALAEQEGFTVIDLYDTFGNEAKTLSWDTVHPHAETIEKAAEAIAESVQ